MGHLDVNEGLSLAQIGSRRPLYTETVESVRQRLIAEVPCSHLGFGVYQVNVARGGHFIVEFWPASRKRAFDGWISVAYFFGERKLVAECFHGASTDKDATKRRETALLVAAAIGDFGFIRASGFKMEDEYDRENAWPTDFGLVKKLHEPNESLFGTMRLAALLADAFIVELLAELTARKVSGTSIGPSSPKVKKILGY